MRERAMTLLEMLVAMLIVLIMMTFLVPLYLRTMKVKSRTEEVAALHARGSGAMGVFRRDLTGAFRAAVAMYDFSIEAVREGIYRSGREFHWEAPVVPGNPASGFRRLTFVSAVDGSRVDLPVAEDPLRVAEYEEVSWSVRGGVISRKVFSGAVVFEADPAEPLPAGWSFSLRFPNPNPPPAYLGGIGVGEPVYNESSTPTISDPGVYRGAACLRTTSYAGAFSSRFGPKDATGTVIPQPVTAILCFPDEQSVPAWAELDFVKAADAAENRLTLVLGTDLLPCALYSKFCPDGRVALGPNDGDYPCFVVIEPGWWSLGEEAEDLVFYAPTGYVFAGPDTEGVWTGGVPRYVDAVLAIADPDEPNTGRRVFGERVAVPAGVEP